MRTRRQFNKLLSLLLSIPIVVDQCSDEKPKVDNLNFQSQNIVLSTWNNENANKIALDILQSNNAELLTAIEKAVNSVELNPDDMSVGYGGRPDRDGHVTLDACIMDHLGNAGSVTFLENYVEAVSVARRVLENTPHVMLSGIGAEQFADSEGFAKKDLFTAESRKQFKEWRINSEYKPQINIEQHDTIGLLAMNRDGNLSGACSTSGVAYKMRGRVGDSPIIGSGLYVDNEYGCATATGLGELVMESCSSFLAVELMRQGMSPMEACKECVQRIIKKKGALDAQVGILALNKSGEFGAYSIQKGFTYVLTSDSEVIKGEASSYYNKS